MIEKLTNGYFQKSLFFLYPLLRLPRVPGCNPVNTYCRIEGSRGFNHGLYTVFRARTDPEYLRFRRLVERSHMFHHLKELDGYHVYFFNMDHLKKDYDLFMLGKYSHVSEGSKRRIIHYHRERKPTNAAYMQTFLNPSDWFEIYANLLGEPMEDLESLGELCNRPNMEAETLIVNGTLKSWICDQELVIIDQNAQFTFILRKL